MRTISFLDQVRPASWPLIGLAAVTYCAATLLINAVLFQGQISNGLGQLYVATDFLLNSALVGGLVEMVLLGTVLVAVGRLRPSNLGWRLGDLRWGLVVTFVVWAASQLTLALIAAIDGRLEWNDWWQRQSAAAVVGRFVGQFFGNALLEETACRGFFLPQLYLKSRQSISPKPAVCLALLGSSGFFAIAHIPNRLLVRDITGIDLLVDQLGLVLAGVIFAAIYLVTQNLFVAVGLHSLVNLIPEASVVKSSDVAHYAGWFASTVVLLLAWWLIGRRIRHDGRVGPREGSACANLR